MAYDDVLADRIRELLAGESPVDERRMFGGLAFLVGGHMAVAVSGSGGLMVRVDPDRLAGWVEGPGVEAMVMGGRTLKGWLLVDDDHLRTTRQLRTWLDRALAFVRTLPPKR